jgi:hypothetical protein
VEGNSTAIAAYLLSNGSVLLSREHELEAKFQTRIGSEQKLWDDPSIPIPNVMLFLLRESSWIPATDGRRLRPSEFMLSSQGIRIMRGIYARHAIDPKNELIVYFGGRDALEALLTRLGAASSLETLSGHSIYELLLALPDRDPNGARASGIYRTLIDSSITVDESPQRDQFIMSGYMWGKHKSVESYLPVNQLRYNSNLTITKAIESHIPLVDIPRRKNTSLVKQLFGISSLTSAEIQLELVSQETQFDPGSEDANQHLQSAIPYIYALRLARTLDEQGRELRLLKKIMLRVCPQAQVSAMLPGGATETVTLSESGARIVVGSSLIMVGEYIENGPGSLAFWLGVAELVAELLGTDIADEVGGILRCRTSAEMQEVVSVRLGNEADETLAEARSRFDNLQTDTEKVKNDQSHSLRRVQAQDECRTPRERNLL